MKNRVTSAGANPPSNVDERHEDFHTTRATRLAAGQKCGVAHYGSWGPTGQGFIIGTADSRGASTGNTSHAADHLPEFYDDLGPMFQGLGLAFSAIDPVIYRK